MTTILNFIASVATFLKAYFAACFALFVQLMVLVLCINQTSMHMLAAATTALAALSGGTADFSWLTLMNYFLPLDQLVVDLVAIMPVLVFGTLLRIIKACIPFISG